VSSRPRILALMGGGVLFGQERGNIEALAALKEEGCEVLCIVRENLWRLEIPRALDARDLAWTKAPYIEHRIPGRLLHVIFRNPIVFLRANWRFMRIVRQFRPTHIHAFNQVYVLNFMIGLSSCRAPMVYRAGDQATLHNWFWRLTWNFVLWRTGMFVANSQFVARTLLHDGVSPEKLQVIYNAPPKRTNEAVRSYVLPEAPDLFKIVYVGQISEHKGVHILVDAFRVVATEFPEALLVIAGRISEWSGDAWGRALRETAKADPQIGERIFFLGETEDIPSLLSSSCIHVAPSLFDDPSPNVVVEAKQAGRASIVFPRGGMPELVRDSVDGFVCTDATSAALVTALRRYLSDQNLARVHGVAAHASLLDLGVPEFPARWLEIYQTLKPKMASAPPVSSQ